MTKRQSNRPERRIAAAGSLSAEVLAALASRLRYVGASTHKLHPGDYGLIPPINPRPTKSVCDDLRAMRLTEAVELFRRGIIFGMVSAFEDGSTPKYVWSVDEAGAVYEAKTKPGDDVYHGYRLGDDERDMRRYVVSEWRRRCEPG